MASTNKTEVETKVISVRVPVEDYIVILKEALTAKVPLSDFIKSKIFMEFEGKEKDNKESDKRNKKYEGLETKYFDLKFENNDLKRELKEKDKEIKKLKTKQ